MFNKVLIANRGEIACRVAATARRLGLRTVAVYSEADANAAHVQACDEAICIGPAAARESYLQAERILEAARRTGAQAIHPGYGFLSENADFAQACQEAGLVFIGPPAQAIAAMGNKAAAKALMSEAGVPLVPGYHGQEQAPAFLHAQAHAMGYPVLIKASAGGGGKGMRRVDQHDDFLAALASCQREAANSFGNDHVLVERYIKRPRHIEVQIFGDQQGQIVHLFERDCSVQRRHQKVLEEAPAPGLSEARRAEMGQAAVAAARSVGYVGAGTVEFIAEHDVDTSGRFYFMEMNTRLQVEHPVTEAITGLDLVEWQLRVASGQPLPLQQHELRWQGHAIEARICAENPQQQFLPAIGRLQHLRAPSASRFTRSDLRLDMGVREGDDISPHYDSMIAKLIAWGPDRETARQRLVQGLSELHITGLHTNVAFLQEVLQTPSFALPDLDTALIEREAAQLFAPPAPDLALNLAALAARLLHEETRQDGADPWDQHDGWRLHGQASRHWTVELDGQRLALSLHSPGAAGGTPTHRLTWSVHGQPAAERSSCTLSYTAQRAQGAERFDLLLSDDPTQARRVSVYRHADGFDIFSCGVHTRMRLCDPLREARSTQGAPTAGRVVAHMPGRVVALLVQAGEQVSAGQALVITEAMKMEHTLNASQAGVVSELLCAVGDQVPEGTELLRLTPLETP